MTRRDLPNWRLPLGPDIVPYRTLLCGAPPWRFATLQWRQRCSDGPFLSNTGWSRERLAGRLAHRPFHRDAVAACTPLQPEPEQKRGRLFEDEQESAPLPDLILLDWYLPRVTGAEVLRRVKQHRQLRRIPVLVFSSSEADRDIETAYDNHANGHLTKPGSSDTLAASWKQSSCTGLRSRSFPGSTARRMGRLKGGRGDVCQTRLGSRGFWQSFDQIAAAKEITAF
jgi:CheY-like chemotaxis protein